MPPRIEIIKCIEDDAERLEPINAELRIFDVRMMGFDRDVRIEFRRGFLRDLGLSD